MVIDHCLARNLRPGDCIIDTDRDEKIASWSLLISCLPRHVGTTFPTVDVLTLSGLGQLRERNYAAHWHVPIVPRGER